MDVIIKNTDDSYFYLFKLLNNKNDVVYTDVLPNKINKLIFKKIDSFGYIDETTLLLEDCLKNNIINKVYIEEETILLKKILVKYNINYKILNKSSYYKEELNNLKSYILLKFILDENKQSINNLKFLILGNNKLSYYINNLLLKLNSYCDCIDNNINISLYKYDIIINTTNITINPELLFNVQKNLIIYDLEPTSKIDRNLLNNNYIKYRFINNVSLYLPIAKANLLESLCEYESI